MSDETAGAEGTDIGAVFDAHVAFEFVAKDLDATMETMIPSPHVTHVPTLAGGVGGEDVRRFYGSHFIGHWPEDARITRISRTVGDACVVDEMVMHFTHDVVVDAFLPGVAPTGQPVQLPVVVVAGFEGDKIAFERIYWDQASLLAQIGLLDTTSLPVCGVEQAAKVLDDELPCNALIERAARGS
jgi:carboxymethylenebutenolidase